MLFVFAGTDRKKAREALDRAVEKTAKGAAVVRVSDASPLADLDAALQGGGMFGGPRVVVLDSCLGNEEMRALLVRSLERIAGSEERYLMLEEKVDAQTRKLLEKRAQKIEKFDTIKGREEDNFFPLVNALRQGNKKDLWVLLQREYAAGKAPEMLHGSFFWAAKQMVLKPRGDEVVRGKKLVAELALLPHEARRRGEDLAYALERFVLSSL